jgi:uncharacterized protein HemY
MPTIRDRRVQVVVGLVLLALLGGGSFVEIRFVRAHRAYRQALDALERCEFQEAGTHLQRYLELRPSDTAVRILAAQTARRGGDWDEAARQLGLAARQGGTGRTSPSSVNC